MNAYEPEGLNQPLAPSSGDLSPEPSMPLGLGGTVSDDPGDILAGAGGRKKPSAGALLLIGVIVVGICGLVVMKKLATAGAAIPIDRELDERIKAVLNPKSGNTITSPEELARKERLLSVLNESYHERQVPHDEERVERLGGEVPPEAPGGNVLDAFPLRSRRRLGVHPHVRAPGAGGMRMECRRVARR